MVRGCGTRKEGGLYLVTATSPYGFPIEHFLVDPPIPWRGPRVLRAPMLIEAGGVVHIAMTVGKTYYPYVPDIVEEIRVLGLSKRVPRDFDFTKLTPGRSRILLIHPRAIPRFSFKAEWEERKPCERCRILSDHYGISEIARECKPRHEPGSLRCIFALWPLSALRSHKKVHEVIEEGLVKTPSTTYAVRGRVHEAPREQRYSPGVFARLPITRFEYVGSSLPEDLKEKAEESGWEVRAVEE